MVATSTWWDCRCHGCARNWRSLAGWKNRRLRSVIPFKIKNLLLLRLGLWLFFRRLFSRSGLRRRRSAFALIAGHTFLKTANTFAKPAHQFGDFAAAKKDQHDDRDNQPVHWKFHKASCHLQL